jgi:DNA-binding transcriptional regulator YiaG
MAKVEDALREMIQYHSKRAVKSALGRMPSQVRDVRRQVRALRRAVDRLAGDVEGLVEARRRARAVPPAPEGALEKVRFTKRAARSLRERFDLTQDELAKLLEVSPVTITSWESGKSRPRRANLAQIVSLRNMDQPQVDAALGRQPAPTAVKPEQLKRLRRRFSLTQAELAKLVGVSHASVASWETGKATPGRDSRCAVAGLRGVSPEQVDQRLGRAPGAGKAVRRAGAVAPAEVKAIRKQTGLSQRQLARKLKVSVNSVSNWETGRASPRRATLEKLFSLRK